MLASTSRWLLLVAALLIGVGMLDLGPRWSARVGQLWFVAVALQLGLWLNRGVGAAVRARVSLERHRNGSPGISIVPTTSCE